MYPKFSHQSGRVFSKERFLEETVSYFQRNGSGPASREALLDIGLCRGPRDLMGNRCIHGKLGIWDGVGEMDEEIKQYTWTLPSTGSPDFWSSYFPIRCQILITRSPCPKTSL